MRPLITHQGQCKCAEFLEPVQSWQDIMRRHKEQVAFTATLVPLTEIDDWIVDLFQCTDCGRYWAREDCGITWVTRSYEFFYFVDTQSPDQWLREAARNMDFVLTKLSKKDKVYEKLILPQIQIK